MQAGLYIMLKQDTIIKCIFESDTFKREEQKRSNRDKAVDKTDKIKVLPYLCSLSYLHQRVISVVYRELLLKLIRVAFEQYFAEETALFSKSQNIS